jgi:5-methylcytosine-specific restriction enzyme A
VRHAGEYDRSRGWASERGYGWEWTKYSARRLAEEPWCAVCGRLGTVTDHIVPAREAPALFWEASNHQTLCTECNVRKAGIFGREPEHGGER